MSRINTTKPELPEASETTQARARAEEQRKLPGLNVSRELPSSDDWPEGTSRDLVMFTWPADCPFDDDGRNQCFVDLRRTVERVGALWQRCVDLAHGVSALRGQLPEVDRHAVSQATSLQEYANRLGPNGAAAREQARDLGRLQEYQLGKDLFTAQHNALWKALNDLHKFIRDNGLSKDFKVKHLECQVPFCDGYGAHTRMFKHNLGLALRLFLRVKQEHDQMEAYRRGLPDHAWVTEQAFENARSVYAQLAKGVEMICYTPPDRTV
jgi:hypothetical protein